LFFITPWIEQSYGLFLAIEAPSLYELKLMGLILVIACVVGTVPALRAYRQSLADGMSVQR
jgi:putative ABC transport system permease protein